MRVCPGCSTDEDGVCCIEVENDQGFVCDNCIMLYDRVDKFIRNIPRCQCGKFDVGKAKNRSRLGNPPYACEKCTAQSEKRCHFCKSMVSSLYYIIDTESDPIILCDDCKEIGCSPFISVERSGEHG